MELSLKMGRSPGIKVAARQLPYVKETYNKLGYQSQTVFAELVGLSRETVRDFLNGKSISASNFQLLCERLKLDWQEVSEQTDSAFNSFVDLNNFSDAPLFVGRLEELRILKDWITNSRCRLIAITGIGGIGKTALSLKLAHDLRNKYEFVAWQSLLNSPTPSEILADLLKICSGHNEAYSSVEIGSQISHLIRHLRDHKCLIVLDNIEGIFQPKSHTREYREDCEKYGDIFKQIAESNHQSCLVLNGRDKPAQVEFLEDENGPVRSLSLTGFSQDDGRAFVTSIKKITGSNDDWYRLVSLYGGNPLALKIAASYIKRQHENDIHAFLSVSENLFRDMKTFLDDSFRSLSELEVDVVYWLSINREPVSLNGLLQDVIFQGPERNISRVLDSLLQKDIIEKRSSCFILQPLLMEYTTERFIDEISEEIKRRTIRRFSTHALQKAQSKNFVSRIQRRLIVEPLSQSLSLYFESIGSNLKDELRNLVALLRSNSFLSSGYAGANILSLLAAVNSDLREFDFSHLSLRQADLQSVKLPHTNFTGSSFDRCLFTQKISSVFAVTTSPDGKLAAAGDTSGDIHLWEVESGKHLQTLRGHTNWVMSVAFHPDGNLLASGGLDNTVRIWDVNSSTCLHVLEGHSGRVWSVKFSPSKKVLASGSDDQTIRIWDPFSANCLGILDSHKDWVTSIDFSPDGRQLASCSNNSIMLWDMSTQKCINTIDDNGGRIWSVCFSPDGSRLASGSDNHAIRIWSVVDRRSLSTLTGHRNRVRSVEFNLDGSSLASGSDDGEVRVWDTSTGKCLSILEGHSNWVWSVKYGSDGKTLISGSEDQSIKVWDTSDGCCLQTLQGYTHRIRAVSCSPDGAFLVSGGVPSELHIWNLANRSPCNILSGHSGFILGVAYSPDGKLVASSSDDQTVRVWDASSGECMRVLQGHNGWIRAISFGLEENTLVSCSDDKTVKLWDLTTGSCLRTMHGHTNWVTSAHFNPVTRLLATGSYDKTIRIWDTATGECSQTLQGHGGRIMSVSFSLDGSLLASCGDDQTIRIWDPNSGVLLHSISAHSDVVRSVSFSPSNQFLASGSADREIKVWSVDDWSCSARLLGHTNIVRSVAFSPDSKTIISGSEDETIRLWELSTAEQIGLLKVDRPYEGMNISMVSGISEPQIDILLSLGAVNHQPQMVATDV